jgi:hypothetical protein
MSRPDIVFEVVCIWCWSHLKENVQLAVNAELSQSYAFEGLKEGHRLNHSQMRKWLHDLPF